MTEQTISLTHLQNKAYQFLKNVHGGILSMPCGSGKTIVGYFLSRNHKTTVIVAHNCLRRDQLMGQFKNYYKGEDVNFEIDSEKISTSNRNILCIVHTSCKIIDKLFEPKDDVLLIIDDFHLSPHMKLLVIDEKNQLEYDEKSHIGMMLDKNYKFILVSNKIKIAKKYYRECEK